MKDALLKILDTLHRYHSVHMAKQDFGLDEDIFYDALVVAPSYTPYKLHMDETCKVTTRKEGSYLAGYLVETEGLNIAWIKTASSAGNVMDHLAICAELSFRQLIFVGAVGALKEGFMPGDVCTPLYSLSGSHADSYLMKKSIRETMLFQKVLPDMTHVENVIALGKERGHHIRKASVFCTPSVALEYVHLDEIRAFGTDLIEMETASFYLMADLFELPAVALLVVSDNSATGVPLVGRSAEEEQLYEYGKTVIIPDMIVALAKRQRFT